MVRCRPHSIVPIRKPGDSQLHIAYATDENSGMTTEQFRHGGAVHRFSARRRTPRSWPKRLGVELNPINLFVAHHHFEPVVTSRPGIYVCGVIESPKDIPETMVQASAAACMAARISTHALHRRGRGKRGISARNRDVTRRTAAPSAYLSVTAARTSAAPWMWTRWCRKLPNIPMWCMWRWPAMAAARKPLDRMRQMIQEKNLNRVVVGACSPRTHEGLFQENLRKAGLNKYLLEIANIRDQNAWVHKVEPGKATAKAKKLDPHGRGRRGPGRAVAGASDCR
jgi:heterodisulfide reductase subunit A2